MAEFASPSAATVDRGRTGASSVTIEGGSRGVLPGVEGQRNSVPVLESCSMTKTDTESFLKKKN